MARKKEYPFEEAYTTLKDRIRLIGKIFGITGIAMALLLFFLVLTTRGSEYVKSSIISGAFFSTFVAIVLILLGVKK